jgi:hypothetical protein
VLFLFQSCLSPLSPLNTNKNKQINNNADDIKSLPFLSVHTTAHRHTLKYTDVPIFHRKLLFPEYNAPPNINLKGLNGRILIHQLRPTKYTESFLVLTFLGIFHLIFKYQFCKIY